MIKVQYGRLLIIPITLWTFRFLYTTTVTIQHMSVYQDRGTGNQCAPIACSCSSPHAATLLSFGRTPAQVREWQMEEWATQVNQATEQALLNESLRAFPSFTGVCI